MCLSKARLVSACKPARPVLCIYLLPLVLGNSEHCRRCVSGELLQASEQQHRAQARCNMVGRFRKTSLS